MYFQLQQSLGVKMLLIQDSTENIGQSKPLRITGSQINLDVSSDRNTSFHRNDPTSYPIA